MPTNEMPTNQMPTNQTPTNQMPTEQAAQPASPARDGVKDGDNARRRAHPAAAARALAEAQARRAARERNAPVPPAETNGRGGPDPTRYGDWEVNGLASDF